MTVINLRGRRSGSGTGIMASVFAGEDRDHLQLTGMLAFTAQEWLIFVTALLMGAKQTDGRLEVLIEEPDP